MLFLSINTVSKISFFRIVSLSHPSNLASNSFATMMMLPKSMLSKLFIGHSKRPFKNVNTLAKVFLAKFKVI